LSDLAFGIEVVVVGFIVVMVTLTLLAFILAGFNKLLAPRKKKPAVSTVSEQGTAAVQDTKPTETVSKYVTAEDEEGATKQEVAAALGALMYVLDTGSSSSSGLRIKHVRPLEPAKNMWAQSGRTRAVQARQDFILFRKGKYR